MAITRGQPGFPGVSASELQSSIDLERPRIVGRIRFGLGGAGEVGMGMRMEGCLSSEMYRSIDQPYPEPLAEAPLWAAMT